MARRHGLLAAMVMALMTASAAVNANSFKWAFQGDVQSLDPHGLNETFTLGFLGNVYEGLVAYDTDMSLQPGLAVSWENTTPTTWVFKLRRGVESHDGGDFTADDVLFSWKRALSESSDMKAYAAKAKDIRKSGEYTIEIETPTPNPILSRDLVFLYIMDRQWAERHDAVGVTNVKGDNKDNHANLHANGTGPFRVIERQPEVRTIFARFENYWGEIPSNISESIFTPIAQDATRVAALISGELDLVYPVPVQDWNRLSQVDGVRSLAGPEARTIFLGLDQNRTELLYSNVKSRNPFKDVRVRKAFAHAIDLETMRSKLMRGAAWPSGLLVAPQVNGHSQGLNVPYPYDPTAARRLLAEAGYPDGFEVTLDCPNNRYVNDEKICQAVAGMLAKVGVTVKVFAQTKSKYFAKVLAQNDYDTSFYLLGWTPGTMDSHNVLLNLATCREAENKTGVFNLGNYCNPRVDEITALVEEETDQARRQILIDEAFQIIRDDVGYLPLHQQPLSWGIRDNVQAAQRADNVLDLRYVSVN